MLEASKEKMSGVVGEKIADAVIKVREGNVRCQAGFDGEYGYPLFTGESKRKESSRVMDKQKSLTDFGK